jgi:hypothetical protein
MKLDELLKRLENIKIDGISEKHEIAENLAQIFSDNSLHTYYPIMTKDRKIYDSDSYKKLLEFNEISPNNAYVYAFVSNVYYPASYYFPFLVDDYLLLYAYLSKLGFQYYNIVPATGLKYISVAIRFMHNKRVVVEVADIDTVTTNTKLSVLIRDILGTKYMDYQKIEHVRSQLNSQKPFAGYGISKAWKIANRYYQDHDTSLAEEVEAIRDAYNRIFQPYRLEYDLNTRQFQVSGSNENR